MKNPLLKLKCKYLLRKQLSFEDVLSDNMSYGNVNYLKLCWVLLIEC